MKDADVVSIDSCPGRQNACIIVCEPAESSDNPAASLEMLWTEKGPAAKAMCCTEVRTACENKKMHLFELLGCAICHKYEDGDNGKLTDSSSPSQ